MIKFIVLTRSRTGSNMVISFLNSHRNINAKSEIFRDCDKNEIRMKLENVFNNNDPKIMASGFKIFYYHPLNLSCPELWNNLINLKNLKIIHLKRKNILKTLVSKKIAENTGCWESEKNIIDKKKKQLYINYEELEKGFQITKNWEKQGDLMFEKHHKIIVHYEDIVDSPVNFFIDISNFLNLPVQKLNTKLKKQNPEKLSELIINYEELKKKFGKTEWGHFFE